MARRNSNGRYPPKCSCRRCLLIAENAGFSAGDNGVTEHRIDSDPSPSRVTAAVANAALIQAAYSGMATDKVDDQRRDQLRLSLMRPSPYRPHDLVTYLDCVDVTNICNPRPAFSGGSDGWAASMDQLHPDGLPRDDLEYVPDWPQSVAWPGHPAFGFRKDGRPLGKDYIQYNRDCLGRDAMLHEQEAKQTRGNAAENRRRLRRLRRSRRWYSEGEAPIYTEMFPEELPEKLQEVEVENIREGSYEEFERLARRLNSTSRADHPEL